VVGLPKTDQSRTVTCSSWYTDPSFGDFDLHIPGLLFVKPSPAGFEVLRSNYKIVTDGPAKLCVPYCLLIEVRGVNELAGINDLVLAIVLGAIKNLKDGEVL
jgi:hypothetical protein